MNSLIRKSLFLFTAFIPALSQAVVVGPYTPDANTVFLFHLDEASLATTAVNAPGTIAAGTNAIAYKQGTATSANSPTDATILGAVGASGFAFGNFGKAATITHPGTTITNGIGVDMNGNGAFNLNNGNSPNNGDSLANSSLILGPNNSFTVEALINLPDTNAGNREIVCADNGQTRSFQFRVTGTNVELNTLFGTPSDFLVPIPRTGPHAFVPNSWFHVALAHSEVGGNPTNVIYWTSLGDSFTTANAILTTNAGPVNPAAQLILDIGNEARGTGGSTEGLRGSIDEVRISRGARGATQMMFSDGTITIAQQPQPQVVAPGATATFTVTATSPISSWAPLGYQWRSNGVALVDGGDFSGVMTPSLVIANAQSAYEANYDVVITNLYQTNTSVTASLIVHTPLNLSWRANFDFNWNTSTSNWFDTVNLANSLFTGGDVVTFDDSGNNASPITVVGTLLPGSVTVNSTLPYAFAGNGKISGSGSLSKANSATLTIQTTNDYTGVTMLGGGIVSVSNLANGLSPSALGAASSASANLVFDSGTLQYTGPTVSANRGATLNAGGGTVEVTTVANSLTLGGVIAGSSGGNLTKTGNGTLALTGANTYDGATIVSAGTLQLTGSGTFGAGNVTNNSALLFSGTRTVANAIAGTGNLTNDATGTLTLSGVSSYSGQTVINGPLNGGLIVANSAALGNSPLVTVISTTAGADGGTRVTLNSGVSVPSVTALSLPCAGNTVRSTLYAAGASSWNGPITLVGDNSPSPNDQLAFAGSGGALTIGGNITGVNFPGTLQLRGDGNNAGVGGSILGTISLAGNATVQVNDGVTWAITSTGNSWGISEIARGTLQIGQNNALPIGTSVKMGAAGNANLDLAGFSQQIAALTNVLSIDIIGNSSTTSDSTLVYSTNNATSSFAGSIVDALGSGTRKTALTVAGGTLLLNASNSYSGPTTISAGTLALGANGSISNSTSISIAAGATFDVSAPGSYTLSGSTSLSAAGTGTTVGSTAAAIKGGTSVNLGSQPVTLSYDGSDPALFISQGTLSLNGNAFTVNGSPLAAGSHVLVHQAAGSINSAGSFPEVTGTAIAPGTTNFATVSGADLVLNVLNVSATTLTRTIGPSPSTYGTPLRFHAVVTPAPADGETISFFAGLTLIGTATTTGGAADLDIANLPASGIAYTVTATYPGDALNTASTGTLAGDQVVNPATVTPSVTVANKVYDGTTAATITARSLAGIVGSDDVNLDGSGTAIFGSANVGTAVSVSVSGLSLSGTTAGNYVLSSTSISTNADITAATLTYVANPASRAYGTANPTFTGSVTGFVNGEDQSGATTGTLTFTSPATSTSAPGSYAIDGSGLTANFGNYTFIQAAGNATALTVGPATVTPIVSANNKVYDGTTNATVASRTLQGVIGTDDVALDTNDVAYFASANVGTGISVTVSNLSLTGSVATNYVLSTSVVTTNADITPATLTYVADPTNRFYGTANPDFTGTVSGFVNGENVASAMTGTSTFTSSATPASLPGHYAIIGSGLTANFGNYVFVQAAGNATALTITVNASPVSLTIDRAPNSIVISWPADHLGWSLQVQTNSVTSGIWTDVPGSTTTNQVVFPSDSLTSGMSVYRLVAPTPTPTPVFPSGLIANNFNFAGNFKADSFDSALGPYSKNTATDHALVASRPGSPGFIVSGTAVIRGYVATGVGGVVTVSGQGLVGDFNYNVKGIIQPGHLTNTFDTVYPAVTAPFGPTTPGVRTPTSGTIAGTAYNYMLNGGFYYAPDLAASGGTMYVGGTTMLLTTGAVNLTSITFASNPTNPPQLNLVYGGSSLNGFSISLVNGSAPQFWLYALPSCTSLKMNSGSDFVGVIYAPTTDLSAQGGSITGAVVANSFLCQGNFSFHYDDETGNPSSYPPVNP
jgi:autotransporter-associated beta strand protein